MNYTSIEDIFKSTNLTIIRNGVTEVNGMDIITAPSWLKFDGKKVNTIYVSGNFFIGFDSSTTEHLKINRISGRSYSVHTEEGTYDNHRKFFSIKFRGTDSSSTASNKALTYMVIFWDDEVISLSVLDKGSKLPTGTNSLTWGTNTLNYTLPSPYSNLLGITFTRQTNGNYIVTNESRTFAIKKYLIRSGSNLYTITDGALVLLDSNETSSSVFQTYGMDGISDITLVKSLENPEVLFYTDQTRFVTPVLAINGIPTLPQILNYSTFDISSVSVINKIQAAGSNDVLLQMSFDGGTTWYYYNQGWVTITDNTTGTSIKALCEIPAAQWSSMATTTINFKAILPTATSEISAIYIS